MWCAAVGNHLVGDALLFEFHRKVSEVLQGDVAVCAAVHDQQLALGLAVGFSFLVLAWFGLDEQTETVSQNSKVVLIVIYSVIPIVLKILAIILI